MPELTATDVEMFTHGRLLASDVETTRMLARAYAAVRRWCGWHVTPVRAGEVVTIDGPGHALLALPTIRLVTLTTVVEDGVTLNIADLAPSATGRLLMKKSGMLWSSLPRAITVTMTHGFDTAPDFDEAVLQAVDFASLTVGTGSTGGLKRYRVDDVEREWQMSLGGKSEMMGGLNVSLLEQFRLIPST